ncbi:MAG: transcription antitermination factor NusB [Phycisphaerales bacterium]|nr:transcription antitermination factor NusB [Phycisphaerales bacterium]
MIHERSQARRIALQALYQLDVQGDCFLDEGLVPFVNETTNDPKIREIASFMAQSTWKFRDTADEWIGRIAAKWPVYRMAIVDRNILRLASWELINFPQTPPKVVLDEAINIGKEYSTADSGNFINGILDALLREHQNLTEKKPEARSQ